MVVLVMVIEFRERRKNWFNRVMCGGFVFVFVVVLKNWVVKFIYW